MSEDGGEDGVKRLLGRRRLLQLSGATATGAGILGTAVDDAAAASTPVTLTGPDSTTVGATETYTASVSTLLEDPEYIWSSTGTVSGDGRSVDVTFDSAGDQSVSVTVTEGQNLIGGDYKTVSVEQERPVIPISGPDEARAGETKTYEADIDLNPKYLAWGATHDDGGKWPEVEEDGTTAKVTFLERGPHTVSAVYPRGINARGKTSVQVSGGPPSVDVTIEGPGEMVADAPYQFEAVPEQDGVEFSSLKWSAGSLSESEYEVIGSGRTVEIEISPEDQHVVTLDYETSEGYSNSTFTSVEVVDLSRDREKKEELAAEVERLAVELQEDDLANVLDDIIDKAERGDADPTTARAAIERMRLMEDVTETTLAGMGSETAHSPERDLVGEPPSSVVTQETYEHPALPSSASVHLTAETVESTAWMAIGVIAGIKAISKLLKKVGLDSLSDGKEILLNQLDSIASLLPDAVSILGDAWDVVNDLFGFIESEEEEDGDTLVDYIVDPVGEFSEAAGDVWQKGFETTGVANSDLEDHLQAVNDEMRGDASGIDLQGTQEGAEAAAQQGNERAEERVEFAVNAFATFDVLSTMGDVLSVSAGVVVALTSLISLPVAAALGLLGTLVTLAGEFLSSTNGAIQLWTLREIHQQSKNGIIAGAEWS